MTYKKHFISFADTRLQNHLNRIEQQAKSMNFYDNISVYNENDLDSTFINEFKDKLIFGSRGFGYWCWKPQIVLQELDKMNYNDILQYSDVGCHLNPNGINRLIEYFNIANIEESLMFQSRSLNSNSNNLYGHFFLEYQWTKADIFNHFNVINNNDIINSGQIIATTFIIKKTNKIIDIINQWKKTFQNNFSLIDDSPSIIPNIEGFIENRHDQSIFSILCKINNLKTLSSCENSPHYFIFSENNWCSQLNVKYNDTNPDINNYNGYDWSMLDKYPILAKKDKS